MKITHRYLALIGILSSIPQEASAIVPYMTTVEELYTLGSTYHGIENLKMEIDGKLYGCSAVKVDLGEEILGNIYFTAAHCLDKMSRAVMSINSNPVMSRYIAPQYFDNPFYDLAAVYLAPSKGEDMRGYPVKPVTEITHDEWNLIYAMQTPSIIVGFGSHGDEGKHSSFESTKRQAAIIPHPSSADLRNGENKRFMISATTDESMKRGKNANNLPQGRIYHGDSGGPFLLNGKTVIGVTMNASRLRNYWAGVTEEFVNGVKTAFAAFEATKASERFSG